MIAALFLAVSAGAGAGDIPDGAALHALDARGDVVVHVKVEKRPAAPSVHGKVEARVDGDTLVVVAPARADKERPVITIVVDSFEGVTAAGRARVDVTGLSGKSFRVATHGAAAVTASGGRVTRLVVDGDGTSHVDAAGLTAAGADVTLAEAARAEVKATDALSCNLERAARLTVKGKPKSVKKDVRGVAKLVLE